MQSLKDQNERMIRANKHRAADRRYARINHFLSDDESIPSLIYWDVYYFSKLRKNPRDTFTFGVWDGKIVKGPLNKASWKDESIEKALEYFKSKNYETMKP